MSALKRQLSIYTSPIRIIALLVLQCFFVTQVSWAGQTVNDFCLRTLRDIERDTVPQSFRAGLEEPAADTGLAALVNRILSSSPKIAVAGSFVSDVIVPLGEIVAIDGIRWRYPAPDDSRLAGSLPKGITKNDMQKHLVWKRDKDSQYPDAKYTNAYLYALELAYPALFKRLKPTLGGPAVATALALNNLGADVKLICAVGCDEKGKPDFAGQMLIDELNKRRMDTSGIKIVNGMPSSTNLIFSTPTKRKTKGGTAYNLALGANAKLTINDITDGVLEGRAVLHLGGIALTPEVEKSVEALTLRAREKGVIVGLDSVIDPTGVEARLLATERTETLFDYIALGAEITGKLAPEEALSRYQGHAKAVFAKYGRDGMYVAAGEDSPFGPAKGLFMPAVWGTEVADETGAGDAACAGIVIAAAAKIPAAQTAKIATALGSMACEQMGGGGALGENLEEVLLEKMTALDRQLLVRAAANWMRMDIVRMTSQAGSGHPGGSLSSAEILAALYFGDALDIASEDVEWNDRYGDNVVISKGHISPAGYSALALSGFIPVGRLDEFRESDGTGLPGHMKDTVPGVSVSTGALGQGLSEAGGMAFADKLTGNMRHTVVVLGEAEAQKGQVWEAAQDLAKLGISITVIVDMNDMQIDGPSSAIVGGNMKDKWRAFGWRSVEVDGHKPEEIIAAVRESKKRGASIVTGARKKDTRPTVILAHTIKGKGVRQFEATLKGQQDSHGKPLSMGDAQAALEEIGATLAEYPRERIMQYAKSLQPNKAERDKIKDEASAREKALGPLYEISGQDAQDALGKLQSAREMSLRDAFALAAIAHKPEGRPVFMRSGDLSGSDKTGDFAKAAGWYDLNANRPSGGVLRGQIAEGHLYSFMSGMARSGWFIPWFGTFERFADDVQTQMRTAVDNGIPVRFVRSHVGVAVGEDGESHHGKALGNTISMAEGGEKMHVFTPALPIEVLWAYEAMCDANDRPSCLLTTRQDVEVFDTSSLGDIDEHKARFLEGSYIAREPKGDVDITLVTLGALAGNAIKASRQLEEEGLNVRVVVVTRPEKIAREDNPFRGYLAERCPVVAIADAPADALGSVVSRAADLVRRGGGEIPFVEARGITVSKTASADWLYEANQFDVKGMMEVVRKAQEQEQARLASLWGRAPVGADAGISEPPASAARAPETAVAQSPLLTFREIGQQI